ncbi:MAG: hypothetical protein A3D28_05430 [Omnitrophica bacterium RIFCSPHIGHO2_02_FULL_63_14]|nr:MAG: hypothetical protein A3D28_05430 [Omnitrophica bacterium RIFCSPHIGHO2_02_FULL_63_14]
MLIQEGLLTRDQLNKAVEVQKKSGKGLIGDILLKSGAITEKDLAVVLSKQLSIPYASRETLLLNPETVEESVKLVPEELARKYCVLPLSTHFNALKVAMADPTDLVTLDNLSKVTGRIIEPLISTRTDIEACLGQFYKEGGLLKTAIEASYSAVDYEAAQREEADEDSLSLDNIVASTKKAPVVNLTDLLICQAVKDRASDIHIESFPNRIIIRFRVDGVLHEIPAPDKSMILPLISRIKILSKMDISEKRLPQDGNLRAMIEGREIDFRVSTIPTIHGEKVVMRILDKTAVRLDLEALGFEKKELANYRKVIHRPHGMILLTGPTGSGKTTTLYAALNELKSPERNILTIEDPVEYQIEGINQVQIKPAIGLTFANGLRSFLRQDPDIILVGEIRDLETAQISIRASLTGHVVFSSLHTNDAPSAISRLIDLGIEPFFVTSSLLMVVAQRLLRRICPKCREAYKADPALMPPGWKLEHGATLYRAKGCADCANTGYFGRFAIFEIMTITDRIEELSIQRSPLSAIRAEARKGGMRTLEESSFVKVLSGETSLEEALRVTMGAEA